MVHWVCVASVPSIPQLIGELLGKTFVVPWSFNVQSNLWIKKSEAQQKQENGAHVGEPACRIRGAIF